MDTSATPNSGTGSMSVMDAVAALDAPLPEETGEQGEVEAQTEEADEVEAVESESEGDEPEEDDGSDDEGDEPEQVAEPESITFEVDGETVTVNRDELKASYMRQKDYTRKTQELAEQRQQIAGERQQYAQLLGALEQQLQQTAGAEPDWDTLRATDPIEYSLQWTEWQRGQQKRQLIAAEQQRMQQLAQVEHQKTMAQTLERERQALLTVVPEWKDAEKAKVEKAMVIEQGKKLGFSDEELAQAFDHRAIVALRKAALYDQLMSKKQVVDQSKPAPQKVVKPGTKGTVDNSAKRRAEQRFNSSGSIRDAAALLSFLKS
jgi:hypothetical protein